MTSLQSWFLNPLPGVSDRMIPLDRLDSPNDTVSQSQCKRYSHKSHNGLPRSYVVRYRQLGSSCAALDLCSKPPLSVEPETPSGPDEKPDLLNRGLAPGRIHYLSEIQIHSLSKGKMGFLIGASTPKLISNAVKSGALTPDQTYTQGWVTLILEEMCDILWDEDEDTLPDTRIEAITSLILAHRQSFYTIGRIINMSLDGTSLVITSAITLQKPATRAALIILLRDTLLLDTIAGKRWDHFYLRAPVPPSTQQQPADDFSYFDQVCEVVPVQSVSSMFGETPYETQFGRPRSHLFQQFVARLTEESATGSLGSIIRGPSIRDGSTLLSNAFSALDDTGTVMDVLPVLRLHCMMLSMDKSIYSTDPTPVKFISNAGFVMDSLTYTPPNAFPCLTVAMSLMTFTSWMSGASPARNVESPNGVYFTPEGIDVDWVAIPIRNEMLGTDQGVVYAMAYLTSQLWHGRVNIKYNGWNDEGSDNYMPEIWTMPSINSVQISGPSKCILVLIDDQNTQGGFISFGPTSVPVWNFALPRRGQGIVAPPDCFPLYIAQFTKPNFQNLCRLADQEIAQRASVYGSTSIGRTLAACMYGSWKPGCYRDEFKQPDVLHGCSASAGYSHMTSYVPVQGTTWKCQNIRNDDGAYCISMLKALNFTSTNSLLCPAAGYASLDEDLTTWSSVSSTSPMFSVPVCNSLQRLRVHLGFYIKTDDFLQFGPSAMGTWSHMLASALSCSTALYLVTNDVPMAVWSGFDQELDPVQRSVEIAKAKNVIFGGTVIHRQVATDIYPLWEDLDLMDNIYLAYGLRKNYHVQLFTHISVPFSIVLQWADKMGISQATSYPGRSMFMRAGLAHSGHRITQNTGTQKLTMACTIDAVRYAPSVIQSQGPGGSRPIFAWYTRHGHDSTVMGGGITTPKMFWMQQSISVAQRAFARGELDDNSIFVSNTNCSFQDLRYTQVHSSPLIWPDPPSSRAGNTNPSPSVGEETRTKPTIDQITNVTHHLVDGKEGAAVTTEADPRSTLPRAQQLAPTPTVPTEQ